MTYKIVLEREAPVKKNQANSAWTRKDKSGNIIPLKAKATWYSKAWIEYAKFAIQRLYTWKQIVEKQHNVKFPLEGEYVVSMIFFRKSIPTDYKSKLDLDNLIAGILDILTGTSGLKLPKKSPIDHSDYKVLADDSVVYVKNHGCSTCFLNPNNPHTEIFISDFNMKTFGEVFRLWHPDAELGWLPAGQSSLFTQGKDPYDI